MQGLKAKGKNFEEVKFGDELYFINPATVKVESVSIKKVIPLEHYPTHIKLHYYKPSTGILINDEEITEGADYLILIVPRKTFFVLTTQSVPTVFSTSQDVLEEWMTKKK